MPKKWLKIRTIQEAYANSYTQQANDNLFNQIAYQKSECENIIYYSFICPNIYSCLIFPVYKHTHVEIYSAEYGNFRRIGLQYLHLGNVWLKECVAITWDRGKANNSSHSSIGNCKSLQSFCYNRRRPQNSFRQVNLFHSILTLYC